MVSDEEFYDWKIDMDAEIQNLKADLRRLAHAFDGHCSSLYAHGDPDVENGLDEY